MQKNVSAALSLELSPVTGETDNVGTPNKICQLNHSIAVVKQWRSCQPENRLAVNKRAAKKSRKIAVV
jgi:hypothetical protein